MYGPIKSGALNSHRIVCTVFLHIKNIGKKFCVFFFCSSLSLMNIKPHRDMCNIIVSVFCVFLVPFTHTIAGAVVAVIELQQLKFIACVLAIQTEQQQKQSMPTMTATELDKHKNGNATRGSYFTEKTHRERARNLWNPTLKTTNEKKNNFFAIIVQHNTFFSSLSILY